MNEDLRTPACVGITLAILYFAGFLCHDWSELRGPTLLAQLMLSLILAVAVTFRGRKWWTMLCVPWFSSRLCLSLRPLRFDKTQQHTGSDPRSVRHSSPNPSK
jgi:hypothetical protein